MPSVFDDGRLSGRLALDLLMTVVIVLPTAIWLVRPFRVAVSLAVLVGGFLTIRSVIAHRYAEGDIGLGVAWALKIAATVLLIGCVLLIAWGLQ